MQVDLKDKDLYIFNSVVYSLVEANGTDPQEKKIRKRHIDELIHTFSKDIIKETLRAEMLYYKLHKVCVILLPLGVL